MRWLCVSLIEYTTDSGSPVCFFVIKLLYHVCAACRCGYFCEARMNINLNNGFVNISISSEYDLNLTHLQDFLESLMSDYEEILDDEVEGKGEGELEEGAEEEAI
jgi:hypothetical protein